jgi:hypothetical protein
MTPDIVNDGNKLPADIEWSSFVGTMPLKGVTYPDELAERIRSAFDSHGA